jgi:hypothetical protein
MALKYFFVSVNAAYSGVPKMKTGIQLSAKGIQLPAKGIQLSAKGIQLLAKGIQLLAKGIPKKVDECLRKFYCYQYIVLKIKLILI